jgi:anion-transporting  ArsA/GET3 family ATPase
MPFNKSAKILHSETHPMSAQLHFISGKGGTGKSTFAAALAMALARDPKNLPILTIDIQGSGHCANLLGIPQPQYAVRPSLEIPQVWGAKIMPQESFQEYFSRSLFPGAGSSLGEATAGIREKIVHGIFSNSIVKSFIEVCPGLEPSAMLGKIFFECTEGTVPETRQGWKHVIVDAPSTGHFLALFSSIEALTRVFSAGIVLRQASEIFGFMKNPQHTQIYLMTLPSELPVRETIELKRDLLRRGMRARNLVVNRMRVEVPPLVPPNPEGEWARFLKVEEEIVRDEQEAVGELTQALDPDDRLLKLQESTGDGKETSLRLAEKITGVFR